MGCHLGCHPGSLQQKCDPDKYPQNSNNNRLCFPSHQTFSIFGPLVVPWGHILDPRGGSVMLACICKIQLHIAFVFFTHPTCSILVPLVTPWDPILDPCCKSVFLLSIRKIQSKVFYLFTHRAFPIFYPLTFFWDPIIDPCCKSMIMGSVSKTQIQIAYVFFAIRHFPFSLLRLSLGIPSWILAAKV